MKNMRKKDLMIVTAFFAMIIITSAISFAFFTYNRTGKTTTSIISGDIEFGFQEGDSVTLINAFPVSDSIGAIDTNNEYKFTVSLSSSSNLIVGNYNISLLTNNDGSANFTNDEIKYNLIKNDTYIIGSSSSGELMTTIAGFNMSSSTGAGIVLLNQEISAGNVDSYILRIWIDENVDYSGDIDSNGTMTGTKNSYTYSIKVKVNATTSNNYSTIPPDKPVLNTTADDWTNNSVSLNIANQDINAANYQYYISTSPDSLVDGEWLDLNDTNFSYDDVGEHYIFVKSFNFAGLESEISDAIPLKIDKDYPTATISIDKLKRATTNSTTATLSMSDLTSGIDISSSKWSYSTTSDSIGLDFDNYTNDLVDSYDEGTDSITLNAITPGLYYLHLLLVDNAGNAQEIISEKSVDVISSLTVINGSTLASGYSLVDVPACHTTDTSVHNPISVTTFGMSSSGFYVTVPATGGKAWTLTTVILNKKIDMNYFDKIHAISSSTWASGRNTVGYVQLLSSYTSSSITLKYSGTLISNTTSSDLIFDVSSFADLYYLSFEIQASQYHSHTLYVKSLVLY